MSSINSGQPSWMQRGALYKPRPLSPAPGSENRSNFDRGYYQGVPPALIHKDPVTSPVNFQKILSEAETAYGNSEHLIFKYSSCPNPTMFIYDKETADSMASMMADRIKNLVFEDSAGNQILITVDELRSGVAVQKLRDFVPVVFLGEKSLCDYFQTNFYYKTLDTDSYDTYTLPASYVDFQSLLTGLESLNELQPKIFFLKIPDFKRMISFKDFNSLIDVMEKKKISHLIIANPSDPDIGVRLWHFNSRFDHGNLAKLKEKLLEVLNKGDATEDNLPVNLYGG